jgi:hypothetical protein
VDTFLRGERAQVWEGVRSGGEGVGATWLKAGIAVEGAEAEWKVRAAGHDDVFLFGPPRH